MTDINAKPMCLGSLPPGTSVETSADGRVRLGGAELPKGATVTKNSDGTVSISGNVPDILYWLKA